MDMDTNKLSSQLNNKIKVLTVLGTRPDAIKLAPVIKEMERYSHLIDSVVVHTVQHRKMVTPILRLFNIKPNYSLNVMQTRQQLSQVTSRVLLRLEQVIKKEQPNLVLVQGDTTSAFAGALCAFYHKIPIGHVEAGLRSYDKYNPYPEEINRKLISSLSDIHFAPTKLAKEQLIKENIARSTIFVTGNPVIDALYAIVRSQEFKKKTNILPYKMQPNSKLILVEVHRRENWGEPIIEICSAIKELVDKNKDVEIVFPVHLQPAVRSTVYRLLSNYERIHLISPLDYLSFVKLMANSYLIMTDSGGLQEEAPALGKPVLVLRKVTERKEAVLAGTVKLVGTDKTKIIKVASELLNNQSAYQRMAQAKNPYGDGKSAQRIVRIIINFFQTQK